MKKVLLNAVLLFATVMLICSSQTSCEKETVTKTDTVFSCVPVSKDAILIKKTWKVDFVYSLISGTLAKYVNGGVNTTGINFDNQNYTFNADGTGIFINPSGNSYPLTWSFSTADKRTMVVIIPGLSNTSTWEMVDIADNYLQFTVTAGGSANVSTYRLKQIP